MGTVRKLMTYKKNKQRSFMQIIYYKSTDIYYGLMCKVMSHEQ